MRITALAAALSSLGILAALPAAAQLPSASAAALGTGDNYTAMARGFNAVAWNPANLGLAGNPPFSISVLGSVRGSAGIGPIGLADVAKYDGQLLSADVKSAWLDRVHAEGGEHGAFGADITFLAASAGRLAFQLSTRADAIANLPPDLAELALFGNAGKTGDPRNFNLVGTSFNGSMTTTSAVSYAQPLPLRLSAFDDERFSLGVTVKYTVGHLVALAQDNGSVISSNPLGVQVRVPMITIADSLVRDNQQLDFGHGVGVDVGAAWQGGPLTLGVTVRNLFNNFAWDTTRLVYRPGESVFNSDTSHSTFVERPYGEAPASLRAYVADYDYKRTIALGAALRLSRRAILTVDARERLADGALPEPKMHIGAGLEIRPLGWIPLRAGGAMLSGGWQAGGGAGLEFGPINLAASAVYRSSDSLGTGTIGMVGLTFGAH